MDYVSPNSDVLELRVENFVCTSPGAWDDSINHGSEWGGNGEGYGLE